MIPIQRGPEPQALSDARSSRLAGLRAIAAGRDPTADDIHGYAVVAHDLWKAQRHKCCYCESQVQRGHNDVEHFRPKGRADRAPGCAQTHGYWWLAFTWENLLFSCPNCNRGKAKVDRFPLEGGSTALVAEQLPPGDERPLLIDPASESGVRHIQFTEVRIGAELKWRPHPRDGSVKGDWTIRVCKLDRDELIDLYTAHVRQRVEPEVEALRAAMRTGSKSAVGGAHWFARLRLLAPGQQYVGLAYDALVHLLPPSELARWKLGWEMPA